MGQFPGQHLGLIEATISSSLGSRGGPCQDHVTMLGTNGVLEQERQSRSEPPDHTPSAVIFQISNKWARGFIVPEERSDAFERRDFRDRCSANELIDTDRTR